MPIFGRELEGDGMDLLADSLWTLRLPNVVGKNQGWNAIPEGIDKVLHILEEQYSYFNSLLTALLTA
jgi:hypothetical protein